jgi:hypothetical protein
MLVGCPSDDHKQTAPDAPAHPADAPPKLAGYGTTCTAGSDCASGLCVGAQGQGMQCSRSCSLDVAQDCKDVSAFCVPLIGGGGACYGKIDTGPDPDDAVLEIGDSVTRVLTPLGDADLFMVKLDQLGKVVFLVTPGPSIDVRLEAYGELGSALGTADQAGPGQPEALQTDVQQVGTHMFLVVRDTGSSTGSYTFSATLVPASVARGVPALPPLRLDRAE